MEKKRFLSFLVFLPNFAFVLEEQRVGHDWETELNWTELREWRMKHSSSISNWIQYGLVFTNINMDKDGINALSHIIVRAEEAILYF